ncbi:MAG: hypothetical protein AAGE01_02850 [Pseudomonadota bacterium]
MGSGRIISSPNPEWPPISNAFGLPTLPVLGWLVGLRFAAAHGGRGVSPRAVAFGPIVACGYAGAIAFAFTIGTEEIAGGFFFALFGLAFVLPLYRIECLAGFVLGMMLAIGAVLPVVVGGVIALVSLALNPLLRWLWKRARRSPAQQAMGQFSSDRISEAHHAAHPPR